MQVFVFVLNRTEYLEPLMQQFSDHGLKGATVLDSRGMARILVNADDMPMFSGLRALLEPERKSSKTIFCVMEEREAALQNMKLHFSRLEAEAYLELDCTSSDVSWYAGSVLKHLSLLKRAGAILDLLPTKGECEKTLAILTGIEQ